MMEVEDYMTAGERLERLEDYLDGHRNAVSGQRVLDGTEHCMFRLITGLLKDLVPKERTATGQRDLGAVTKQLMDATPGGKGSQTSTWVNGYKVTVERL
jgi:hypothetical protein